jgi:hypothetical protein
MLFFGFCFKLGAMDKMQLLKDVKGAIASSERYGTL